MGINIPVWASCIFWGIAMLTTAVAGFGFIKILNIISVPALFVFLLYGLATVLGNGGAAAVINYVPPVTNNLVFGITIVVGGFAAGAITSGDYNRYCKNAKDAALACVIGVLPSGIGIILIGAVLAISTGNYDITYMFASLGMPLFGMAVLILATWTTNTGNAYSSGIAVVNLFKLRDEKRVIATLICGVLGIILSLGGIINQFVTFLSFLGVFIPPIAGVVIADYWILGKGNAKQWKPYEGVNWIGIISWIAGVAASYFSKFFIPILNGIIVSLVLYIILMSVIKNSRMNPFVDLKEKIYE